MHIIYSLTPGNFLVCRKIFEIFLKIGVMKFSISYYAQYIINWHNCSSRIYFFLGGEGAYEIESMTFYFIFCLFFNNN